MYTVKTRGPGVTSITGATKAITLIKSELQYTIKNTLTNRYSKSFTKSEKRISLCYSNILYVNTKPLLVFKYLCEDLSLFLFQNSPSLCSPTFCPEIMVLSNFNTHNLCFLTSYSFPGWRLFKNVLKIFRFIFLCINLTSLIVAQLYLQE